MLAPVKAMDPPKLPKREPTAKQLIYKRFGSGWLGHEMVCIAKRESRLRPDAINWRDVHTNGRGSFGLFQIGRIHLRWLNVPYQRLLDKKFNVWAAYRLYKMEGLGPWGGGCH